MNEAESRYAALAAQAQKIGAEASGWQTAAGWLRIAQSFRDLVLLRRTSLLYWQQRGRDEQVPATAKLTPLLRQKSAP